MAPPYRSAPPLPGNDIVTLLALGQTSSASTMHGGVTGQAGAAVNSGATALLTEAISSQLGGGAERLFGITRFRFCPGLAGFCPPYSFHMLGSRFTVVQQVYPD